MIASKFSSVKRKNTVVDEDPISEQIKRCRISCSPGELRLQKDITEVRQLEGIRIEYTEYSSNAFIAFTDNKEDCPNNFLVTVSRFYPHTKPLVRVLDNGYVSTYISQAGEVIHEGLTDQWTAIGSLATVVHILRQVREFYNPNNSRQSPMMITPQQSSESAS